MGSAFFYGIILGIKNIVNFINFMKKKSFISISLSWIVSATIVFGTVVFAAAPSWSGAELHTFSNSNYRAYEADSYNLFGDAVEEFFYGTLWGFGIMYKNTGTGNWDMFDIAGDLGASVTVKNVSVGDMDGDSNLDIIVGRSDTNTTEWWEAPATVASGDPLTPNAWTLRHSFADPNGKDVEFVEFVDINGDGNDDVLALPSYTAALYWWENDGGGDPSTFTRHDLTGSLRSSHFTVDDLDDDTDLDIVLFNGYNDDLMWLQNNGNETFQNPANIDSNLDLSLYAQAQVIDVDEDGHSDIVASSQASDHVVWYQASADATPTFTKKYVNDESSPDCDGAAGVYADDIDNDSDIDVLVVCDITRNLQLYLNDGSENFSTNVVVTGTLPTDPHDIALGNIDDDSYQDFIVSSYSGAAYYWYESTYASNTGPTAESLAAVQKADGSGAVDISVILDDADNNDTVYATIKYEAGSCTGSEVNAALDSTPANVSATTGTPVVSGAIVGTEAGWILTSSGANTVQFDWLSASNVASADGTYCIQLTSHDGTAEGAIAVKTFTVDNVDPTASGNLTLNAITTTSITHDLGVAGSDTNIDNYKIYYKAGASGVATTNDLDVTIATAAYDADGTNEISGLSVNTQYVANIWTYDAYGNGAAATEIAKYTAANAPGIPTVDGATVSALNVTIDVNSNPATTEFAIQETGTGFYVQANGTLSGSAVWQAAGTGAGEWGETSAVSGKVQVTGLSLNTQYTFQVIARNGDDTITAFSSTAASYTLAEASSAPTVDTPTTSSLGVTISEGSNPSTTTYKIQETGGSLYVQADGTLGAGEVWQTAANWGTGGKKIVTGLSVNAQYTFVTTGRNVELVPTAASSSTAAYTAANAPGVPTVDGAATTTLNVTIDTNSNPSTTEYYIYEVNTAQYVQADGTLSGVVVWEPIGISADQWGSTSGTAGIVVVSGLSVNTTYDFKIKARNGDDVETAYGTSASLYTLANVPISLNVSQNSAASSSQIDASWGANGNASGTEYYIENTTVGTNSDWITGLTWSSSGLNCQTTNSFKVKARNTDAVETAYTAELSAVTAGCGGVVILPSMSRTRSISTQSVDEEDEVVEDEDLVEEEEGEEEVVVEDEVEGEEEILEDEDLVEEEEDQEEEVREEEVREDSEVVETETRDEITRDEQWGRYVEPEYIAFEPFEINDDNELAEREEFIEDFGRFAESMDGYTNEVQRYFDDNFDFDGDGISNAVERIAGTDPLSVDTDGDGFSDGAERVYGSDPVDPASVASEFVEMDGSVDSDGDGISDLVEMMSGGDQDIVFGGFDGAEKVSLSVGFANGVSVNMNLGGGLVLGRAKPNSTVVGVITDLSGNQLFESVVSADEEGKFINYFGDLAGYGLEVGDQYYLTVESDGEVSDTMILAVKDSSDSLSIEGSSLGVELIVDDTEEFSSVSWDDEFVNSYVFKFIKESAYSDYFVSFLENLKVSNQGVLFTGVAEPNSRVVFVFESLLTNSVVISDAEGKLSVPKPDNLNDGIHKYTGFVIDMKNNSLSLPIRGRMKVFNVNKYLDGIISKIVN